MARSKEVTIGTVTVRLDTPSGTAVDEVFVGSGDDCHLHLERMDETRFWIAVYPRDAKGKLIKGRRAVAWFESTASIRMRCVLEHT